MIELKIDTKDFERQMSRLEAFPKEAQAAVYQSVKRSITTIRTQISKEIRKESTLSGRKISEAIGKVSILTQGSIIEGVVRVSSESMHLSDYQITPRRQTAQKGKAARKWRPLRWRIERGKAFKVNSRENGLSKAFAAFAKSGKLIVFRRNGKALQAQFGPRVQYFLAFERVQASLEETAHARFESVLEHEINYRLGKLGAK